MLEKVAISISRLAWKLLYLSKDAGEVWKNKKNKKKTKQAAILFRILSMEKRSRSRTGPSLVFIILISYVKLNNNDLSRNVIQPCFPLKEYSHAYPITFALDKIRHSFPQKGDTISSPK